MEIEIYHQNWEKKSYFECQICDMKFYTDVGHNIHFKSARHQRTVSENHHKNSLEFTKITNIENTPPLSSNIPFGIPPPGIRDHIIEFIRKPMQDPNDEEVIINRKYFPSACKKLNFK